MAKYLIGIIGYRNHSKKIYDIFKKNTNANFKIYVHKKIKSKKFINTNDTTYTYYLDELKSCNIIVITSPSITHSKYINLFKSKKRYIFCEKPGVTNLKELKNLNKLKQNEKNKIYFNFNYIQSDFYQIINNCLKLKKYGNLVNIVVTCTHGLYFKNTNLKGRFNNSNLYENIYGNLGIHYINLFVNLFQKVEIKTLTLISTNKKKYYDTVSIILKINDKINAYLFLSYSTIFSQEIKFYLNNGMIEYNNKKIIEFFPRDSFDKSGKFKKPNQKIIKNNVDLSTNSLENSVKYFLNKIDKNKNFSKNIFKKTVETNNLIINSKKIINY